MSVTSLLIANRGEIAIRIVRAAAELGIRTVAVFSEDDAASLHVRKADEAYPLEGRGVAAYLDMAQLIAVAERAGCDAVHPGYGFLSENAEFARRCAEAGLTFVGPRVETLSLFGDKTQARQVAEHCGVPVLPGTAGPTDVKTATEFFDSLGDGAAMMIKAVAGGGGRGMRAVHVRDDVEAAYARCRSEAQAAFGNGDVYVERLVPRARHIEVQVIGDGSGAVTHLGERECSLQRRNQKLVEVAPAPGLSAAVRERMCEAAVRVAQHVGYASLGTFEFLVDADGSDRDRTTLAFMETNARLQVEHTVTEQVTGVDLVQAQLRVAQGRALDELGLTQADVPAARGYAMQVRINMETMTPDGSTRPTGGTLSAFELPSGPGLRTDSFGYAGYTTSPSFDSLLAKLIGSSPSPDFADVVKKTYRALCECRIEGVATNVPFLQNLLRYPAVAANAVYTRFVEDHLPELLEPGSADHRRLFFQSETVGTGSPSQPPGLAGTKVDAIDPLAVLQHGKSDAPAVAPSPAPASAPPMAVTGPDGTRPVPAPLQGTIVSLEVGEGDPVHVGQPLLVMESMKMEHVIAAAVSGVVRRFTVRQGDAVFEGHPLAFIDEAEVDRGEAAAEREVDLDHIRPDLAEIVERHALGLDAARPEAVARRRKTGQRTARENVEDLCDPGSFVEYGPMVIAAQRQRRSLDDLIRRTPADGLIAGVGRVNGDRFADRAAQCIVMSYDYTVLAGTQGFKNHYKKDRLFELAERWKLPVVFFAEGGGGRPGDTDWSSPSGLDVPAFYLWGKLSGMVPLVGITSGRCFAGNAVILGCCDVIIATEGSNIGMGGPAMIEGGGLGVFRPEDVGPMDVQVPNGVVDIPVADEAEAVRVTKQYLSYFQGPVADWECADQRLLRGIVPENRLRVYEVRDVIETLADIGSVLEIRKAFGVGMVTAFIRIEGRPLGVIANNPKHLGGAIDSDAADKATRFMQLCDAFDIPLLTLCDTPGNMVGPEDEKTALVRHCCRMFVTGSSLSVPLCTIVLRKSYGLGAQGMAGGSMKTPCFAVAWPTGEFGGMGLEGAVKLGYRKELEAETDPHKRKALYEQLVARMYESGKALSTATYFEIDDVIDPAASRDWIMAALRSSPPPAPRSGKKRPCIDTW